MNTTSSSPSPVASASAVAGQHSEFLLLFYNSEWHEGLSPQQIQSTMSQWRDWFDGLVSKGKCRGGHPLSDEGRVVSGKARAVSDGPFAESKETICGYFFLQSVNFEEAVEIARNCPALEYGIQVEVRPVMPNCAAAQAAHLAEAESKAESGNSEPASAVAATV